MPISRRSEVETEMTPEAATGGAGGAGGSGASGRKSSGGNGSSGSPEAVNPWIAPHFSSGYGHHPHPPSIHPSPLYTIDLTKSIGSEYAGMIEDILRMVSLQLTIQVMLYFGNATDKIFTEDLFVLMLYIVLGVMFFWLVVKSLVTFK